MLVTLSDWNACILYVQFHQYLINYKISLLSYMMLFSYFQIYDFIRQMMILIHNKTFMHVLYMR